MLKDMNKIAIRSENIPATVEDLSRFVLIGRDRLAAVRAAIRANVKVGVAAEVYQQKLVEAQEIAEVVLDAEVRLGELRKNVERQDYHGGRMGSQQCESINTPLKEFDEKAHLQKDEAGRFEALASHPEVVERVKAEARENGDIVTRKAVLDAIKAEQKAKPHVAYNSGNNEWYTPAEYIEAAREVMGGIDLDPASSDAANRTVQARTYFTAETNGLDKPWAGNVWLNPPYSSELIGQFVDKLVAERENIQQAVVLVNNATETKWFSALASAASAVVFPGCRIKFYAPDVDAGSPLQGQAFLYLGENDEKFLNVFSKFGWGARLWKK